MKLEQQIVLTVDASAFEAACARLAASMRADGDAAGRYSEVRQARANLAAVAPRGDWLAVMAEVDRRRRRGLTKLEALRKVYSDLVVGSWRPFHPLDIAAEHARLAAWDGRQLELRRRFPVGGGH